MPLKETMLTNFRVRSAFARLRPVPVLGWLLSQTVERVVPRNERLWIRLSSGLGSGLTIKVDPRFHVGYLRGDYEPWVQDLLRQHLQPGDTFFDVGAHVGFFVLCAATLVGEHGHIVAMEPDPQNFASLEANVKRNGFRTVTAIKAAAWSSTGQVRFGSSASTSGRSEGRVTDQDSPEDNAAADHVSAIRLDDITGPPPAVVKMDIEGAEAEACRGAEDLLSRQSTVWIVEAHSESLAVELGEIFNRHGYEVTTTSPRHPVYGQYRETYVIAKPPPRQRKPA